jgi:hypothetical protein
MRDWIAVITLATIGTFTFTMQAHAYLDPGTASIILQGIVGGVAAGVATAGIYWSRTKGMLLKMLGKDQKQASAKRPD